MTSPIDLNLSGNLIISKTEELIQQLAALHPLDYERIRKEQAKMLNIRITSLDQRVKLTRTEKDASNSQFADITPWDSPVIPSELLNEITDTIQRFIILDKHQAQSAALWIAATWFTDVIHCAPILLINAPEKACGKTQLLTVLAKLAPRAAQASNISSSVLFRMIETFKPTLFIDEIETVLGDNEELRGIINAGHTRDSAQVWRSVAKGDDFEAKCFHVFCMKAIAGINAIKLSETVTSRSIIIGLRRKRADENVVRIRHAPADLFCNLAAKLARFANDFSESLKNTRPDLPDALGDRDQDNWEPLLQIAMVAGGHWPETAISASLTLSKELQSPQSSANELLADIQEIFEEKLVIKMTTTDLINALCEDTEKSWATYNRGKQLSPRQLASKLKDYGITSKTIRINNYETAKGYEADEFADAFQRYLNDSEKLPSQGNKIYMPNDNGLVPVTDTALLQ